MQLSHPRCLILQTFDCQGVGLIAGGIGNRLSVNELLLLAESYHHVTVEAADAHAVRNGTEAVQ